MKAKRNSIRKLTVCAMLAALSVIVLWLGSVVEVLDVSMAVLASLCCVFAVLEYGKSAPWLVFAVSGILSTLFLPQKTPAVMYVLFFGYYPIIKEKLERLPRVLSWVLKEVVFHAALILMLLAYKWLFMSAAEEPIWYYVLIIALAEVTFPLYDLALTRLISLYLRKWRHRFQIKK